MAKRIRARLTPAEGRKFGFTLGPAFAAVALLSLWRGHSVTPIVAGALGAALVTVAIVAPAALDPVQHFWFGLAAVLSKVTTPIVLGVVYFLVVTPVGLLRRMARKRRAGPMATEPTFWVTRSAEGRPRTGMASQF